MVFWVNKPLFCSQVKDIYDESCNRKIWKKENILFNDTLNTFYLWLYGIGCITKDHSDNEMKSHQQDNIYHCLCYTSYGGLAEMRNDSIGPH